MRVLVTGATGYIGGRLIPRLLDQGHTVRVLVRDATRIDGRPWSDRVEVAVGDAMHLDQLCEALRDIDAAYYFIHSMYAGKNFDKLDKQAAEHFAEAAEGIAHVIYLGGIQPQHTSARSKHLSSRAEVGEILAARLPVTEFRAGPIIGSGSASFEMVRYLTERLPIMIAPRWVTNDVQPVSVRDILKYLMAALEKGPCGVVHVGMDPISFKDMMMRYAHIRGLRRRIYRVPVLAPKLAALWVGRVTPITNRLAVPLVEGIVEPLTASTGHARELFPEIKPAGYDLALKRALSSIESRKVETRWSTALYVREAYKLTDWEGMIREERRVVIQAPPAAVYQTVCSLGGEKGWLVWNRAWRIRGLLDALVGGPGLRRGRRDPVELLTGDAVDFWRVEDIQPGRLLLLRAEMKLPGKAWLKFEMKPAGHETVLLQTALFEPRGALGPLYWYLLYPLHRLIFSDLIEAIAREVTQRQKDDGSVSNRTSSH